MSSLTKIWYYYGLNGRKTIYSTICVMSLMIICVACCLYSKGADPFLAVYLCPIIPITILIMGHLGGKAQQDYYCNDPAYKYFFGGKR